MKLTMNSYKIRRKYDIILLDNRRNYMEDYKLSLNDISSNYFHFTKKSNIQSIAKSGLLPKKSFHAQSLEDTKKVFFVEGLDNLLILFDCWINVCEKYPHVPGAFNLGTKIRGKNKFSKSLINLYFKWTEINKLHKLVAYKYFDWFLKKYILLNIDIKENIDFCFDDIDQIKAKGYDKDYLIKAGYSLKYSDLESITMDKWNLHTFTEHGVSTDKIKICYINSSCKMLDILSYALEHSHLDIENVCPMLWKYLKSRKYV